MSNPSFMDPRGLYYIKSPLYHLVSFLPQYLPIFSTGKQVNILASPDFGSLRMPRSQSCKSMLLEASIRLHHNQRGAFSEASFLLQTKYLYSLRSMSTVWSTRCPSTPTSSSSSALSSKLKAPFKPPRSTFSDFTRYKSSTQLFYD